VDVARFLVEHGAPTSARDNDGRTALHEALSSDHIEVARFLVEHGIDTSTPFPTPAPTPAQAQAPGNRFFYYSLILLFFVEIYFHVM
jgi:ankyrin repeat protein